MKRGCRIELSLTALLLLASLASADPQVAPRLALKATCDTGLGVDGAEIISVCHTDAVAALTNVAGSVVLLEVVF